MIADLHRLNNSMSPERHQSIAQLGVNDSRKNKT